MSLNDNPAPWTELSGRLSNGGHELPIRVYFEDTDFSGVVYHTSYLRWCERGRSDFLRLLGISHRSLSHAGPGAEPCAFAVRRLSADFLKPARIDDILVVHTRAGEITKASVTLIQEIARERQTIFKVQAQCVLIGMSGRLLRLPSALQDLVRQGIA